MAKYISGYDIIGDVHGHAGKLRALIAQLGYEQKVGTWHHSEGRRVIFVGDLIDRGPEQMEAVKLARSMVESGIAVCIMGNHEYNALLHSFGYRELKDKDPHKSFLKEVPKESPEYRECLDWFMTLPLWYETEDVFAVHACPDAESMQTLQSVGMGPDNRLNEHILTLAGLGRSAPHGTKEKAVYDAFETILKGIEIDLPEGVSFVDKDGTERHTMRVRWWDGAADTYRKAAFMTHPEVLPDIKLADPITPCIPGKPVFIGHYWLAPSASKQPMAENIVCVDYSAGKGGPLVAYRWTKGDAMLSAEHFVVYNGPGVE
ncbi:MAG: metallophosphoesterase [Mailhella sp.]|nr:metallophosphoesterase [Mailhella sp.]